jgi:hypothetical protein
MNLRHLLFATILVAAAALRAEPLTRDATVYAAPSPPPPC